MPSCIVQVGDFLASILDSSDPSVSFQAAQGLLQLTRTLSSSANSGGVRAVAGVASSWGALAVAALLQLWDRQLSFAGHAQLMAVITDYLDCLQVCICASRSQPALQLQCSMSTVVRETGHG